MAEILPHIDDEVASSVEDVVTSPSASRPAQSLVSLPNRIDVLRWSPHSATVEPSDTDSR
jgi:hypothetical protein